MQKFSNLYDLIDMSNPADIQQEVRRIALLINPQLDFEIISSSFQDVWRLFAGDYPGYRGCNTYYHDIFHTTDVLLASLRLVHGAAASGAAFSVADVNHIALSAMMHDAGYIQQQSESGGTGGQHTAIHVYRSIEFMGRYFQNGRGSMVDVEAMAPIIHCTGMNVDINKISFKSPTTRLLGYILGTADMLGQMADRYYIEKLPELYCEFLEGGIPGYSSYLDLIRRTPDFYETVVERCKNSLGGVHCFMKNHFHDRWDIAADLYAVAIDNNLHFLQFIENSEDFHRKAKRIYRFSDRCTSGSTGNTYLNV